MSQPPAVPSVQCGHMFGTAHPTSKPAPLSHESTFAQTFPILLAKWPSQNPIQSGDHTSTLLQTICFQLSLRQTPIIPSTVHTILWGLALPCHFPFCVPSCPHTAFSQVLALAHASSAWVSLSFPRFPAVPQFHHHFLREACRPVPQEKLTLWHVLNPSCPFPSCHSVHWQFHNICVSL